MLSRNHEACLKNGPILPAGKKGPSPNSSGPVLTNSICEQFLDLAAAIFSCTGWPEEALGLYFALYLFIYFLKTHTQLKLKYIIIVFFFLIQAII